MVRVGPVYTPPELRGHGYASAATVAVSQAALEAGLREVVLYTDLAKLTGNVNAARARTEGATDEIERLAKLRGADINEAKKILATETTALVHGLSLATRNTDDFRGIPAIIVGTAVTSCEFGVAAMIRLRSSA